jgi:hypothetical protein
MDNPQRSEPSLKYKINKEIFVPMPFGDGKNGRLLALGPRIVPRAEPA